MGLFNGLTSAIGQEVGHALNALPGYSTLGNNITNPDTNYQGNSNPVSTVGSGGNALPQITPSGGAGQVLGVNTGDYSNNTVAADPYAKYGGTAAYNNLVSGFANQKQNIYGTANDTASQLAPGYAQSILDTIHNLTQGQQAIDKKNVDNDASKLQSTQGILASVGQGIKSGGVYLAGRNAGNSSAAQAIANAYGQIGRQQLSQVGNQYAKNQGDIALNQSDQDYATSQAPNKFHLQLISDVNNIVNQARDKFGQLDAAMASASLPDRIAIEQEKENVRGQVLGQLQQYDAQLASGVGGIHAATSDQNLATAQQQIQAGTADPNSFTYTTDAPLSVQDSGPTASNLPLFSLGKRRLA